MSDIDEMTPELRELREHLAALQVLAPPPRLTEIAARGREHRRHRRYVVAGLSAAGAGATAVALAVGLGDGGSASTPVANRTPSPARTAAPTTIRSSSFTLVSNTDGTVTLTIDPTELFEATALQHDLQQDGIPALVTTGKICTSDPAPGDLSQVVTYHEGQPGEDATIVIDPSGLPTGAEVSFGTVPLKLRARAAQFALIDPNAYTCSTGLPPDDPQQPTRGGVYRIGPSN